MRSKDSVGEVRWANATRQLPIPSGLTGRQETVHWSPHTLKIDHPAFKFLETVREAYLYQHVEEPTRIQGGQEPNILNLILRYKEAMVNNIPVKEPLGRSVHVAEYCHSLSK